MPNDGLKTALARSLELFANRKVGAAMQLMGQSLPASVVSRTGGIVTVNFELTNVPFTLPQITVPMIGSEYVRLPIQPGCMGWVIPADAYLGGMSGLGGGTADLTKRPNLSNLVWSPIGNKNWSASEDDNALVLYGPDGTIIRSLDSTAVLKVLKTICSWTPPSGIPIELNGNVIINGNVQLSGAIQSLAGGTYAGTIATAGDIIGGYGTADQVSALNHTHQYLQPTGASTPEQTAKPTAGT